MRQLLRRIVSPGIRSHALGFIGYLYEQEIRVLHRLVQPGKLSVDVGANQGMYTYHLARLSDSVIAYEPIPTLAEALRQWVPPNVAVHQVALSDHMAEARTLVVPQRAGQPRAGQAHFGDRKDEAVAETHAVPVTTLDDEGLDAVGFIKIDVEGHEQAVLEGARRTLATQQPNLLVEIEQRHLKVPIQTVFDGLLDLGYEGYFLFERKVLSLDAFSVDRHQRPMEEKLLHGGFGNADKQRYGNNFIFVPKSRALFSS